LIRLKTLYEITIHTSTVPDIPTLLKNRLRPGSSVKGAGRQREAARLADLMKALNMLALTEATKTASTIAHIAI